MRYLYLLIMTLMPMLAEGQSVREITNIKPFSKITIASGINVILSKSDKRAIRVEGERSVISKVMCSVDETELSIYATKFKYKQSKKINVYVDYDSTIVSIVGSSGNHVRTETPLVGEYIEVHGKNGCDFFVMLDAGKVKAKVSNGSNIRLVGRAEEVDAYADNGSQVKAYALESQSAWYTITLASYAELWAPKGGLNIVASGDSEVYYKGDPSSLNINAVSGARVLPREGDKKEK